MQGMTCDGMYLNISSILLVVIFRRLKCLLTRFLRRSSICWREVCKWGFAGRFWRSLRHCFINQKLKCSRLTSWPSNLVCQIRGLWYPWRGSAVVSKLLFLPPAICPIQSSLLSHANHQVWYTSRFDFRPVPKLYGTQKHSRFTDNSRV